jgi:bacillithiol synthase
MCYNENHLRTILKRGEVLLIERVEYQDRFMQTYLNDFAQFKDLYEYDPQDAQSIPARISYLDHTVDAQRLRDVSRALLRYNQRLGCSMKSEENIQMLAAGNAYAVVTGQQTGLLTGPLYTIYKIMTAISLAEKITTEQGIHAVPVFWAASEDHDFQEISWFSVYNDHNELETHAVASPHPGRFSIGRLPLTDRIRQSMDFLAESITTGPHRDDYLQILHSTYADAANIADWCSQIIARLFARYGLIMVDSMDPDLRSLSVEIIRRAVFNANDMHAAVAQASHKIECLAFKPQLQIAPDALPVFSNTEKGRHQIQRNESGKLFVHGDDSTQWTVGELSDLIAANPDQYSPNVALRPMVQDHLLPTLAYVAGPGELAYYAQLRHVYPLLGQQMPVIYPRFSATLIHPEMKATLDLLGLKAAEVQRHGAEVLARIIRERAPFSVEDRFRRLQTDIRDLYRLLTSDIVVVDPDLEKIAEGNLERILRQVDYLENKTFQKVRKKEKGTVAHIERLMNYLLPGNQEQERVINVFSFLFEYGERLFDQIMLADPANSFTHTYIFLGDDDHR